MALEGFFGIARNPVGEGWRRYLNPHQARKRQYGAHGDWIQQGMPDFLLTSV